MKPPLPLTRNPSTWFNRRSIICWTRDVPREVCQVSWEPRSRTLQNCVCSHVLLPSSKKGMTVIIVAHRLSTIRNADIIFVVQDGQVIEQGNHSDLVEQPDGAYASLIKRQMLVQKKLDDS